VQRLSEILVGEDFSGELLCDPVDGHAERPDRRVADTLLHDAFDQALPRHGVNVAREHRAAQGVRVHIRGARSAGRARGLVQILRKLRRASCSQIAGKTPTSTVITAANTIEVKRYGRLGARAVSGAPGVMNIVTSTRM